MTESSSGGHTPGTLRAASIRGVAWSAAGMWGRQLTQLAVFTLLARLLEPSDFGLVALAGVFVLLFQVVTDFGLSSAIVQRKDVEQAHIDTAFTFGTIVGLVIAVTAQMAADPLAAILGEPRLGAILRVLSLVLVLTGANSTLTAYFRRELRFKPLAIRYLVATAVGGIIGIGVALAGGGAWALVAQTLSQSVANVVVLGVACPLRLHPRISLRHFRELAAFGVNMAGSQVLGVVNRRSDDLLIGSFLGAIALGYYSVAYRFLLVLTRIFTQTISQVALPAFSRLQSEPARMRHAFYLTTRTSSAIAFPAFLGMAVVAPDFIAAVFGPQWAPSVPVMRVLALIGVLHSVMYFNSSVINASGKANWNLRFQVVNTMANVVGFLIAVRFGIVAVALAYVLRGYLLAPVSLWLVHKLITYDVRKYLGQLFAPLSASLLMMASVLGTDELLLASGTRSAAANLAVQVLVGAAVYGLALFLLHRDLFRELVENASVLLRRGRTAAESPEGERPRSVSG